MNWGGAYWGGLTDAASTRAADGASSGRPILLSEAIESMPRRWSEQK